MEKIIVCERDRKESADTTQKIEIYFNFTGKYIARKHRLEQPRKRQNVAKRFSRQHNRQQNKSKQNGGRNLMRILL